MLYRPEVKQGDEVADWAKQELQSMGSINRREVTMGLLAVGALIAWIGGGRWLSPATVALAVVSLMLLTDVVAWGDVLANKQAWSVLVWFATLLTLAEGLRTVGFLGWFAQHAASVVTKVPMIPMLAGAIALYFLIHYMFASLTAQTTALFAVFLVPIISVPGVPAKAAALLLAYSSGLMGVITPYATGSSPIWYGSGYITAKDFWKSGAILGAVYLGLLLALGMPYVLAFMR
jgi:L-tartrate/succinate antiporter